MKRNERLSANLGADDSAAFALGERRDLIFARLHGQNERFRIMHRIRREASIRRGDDRCAALNKIQYTDRTVARQGDGSIEPYAGSFDELERVQTGVFDFDVFILMDGLNRIDGGVRPGRGDPSRKA